MFCVTNIHTLSFLFTDKVNSNDLVIEDSTEGETILGQGRAGVMQLEPEDQLPTQPKLTQSRPRSSAKTRTLGGMSGPITSTEVSLVKDLKLDLGRLVGKPTMWCPNRSDTNQSVQSQKMARGWKFWI